MFWNKRNSTLDRSTPHRMFDELNKIKTKSESTTSSNDFRISYIRLYQSTQAYYESKNEKIKISVEFSGRSVFKELVPDMGLSEVETMGRLDNPDFMSGFVAYKGRISKISRVFVDIDIIYIDTQNEKYEEIRADIKSVTAFISSVTGKYTKTSLDFDQSIKYQFIPNKLTNDIQHLFSEIKSIVEKSYIKYFRKETEGLIIQSDVDEITQRFNKNLDKYTIKDIFTHISDEIDDYRFSLKIATDELNINKEMSLMYKYWRSSVKFKRNENGLLEGSLESSKLLIEMGEAIGRIKDIYSDCDIDLGIIEDEIFLNIRPNFTSILQCVNRLYEEEIINTY